jgi:hypothetical protein
MLASVDGFVTVKIHLLYFLLVYVGGGRLAVVEEIVVHGDCNTSGV